MRTEPTTQPEAPADEPTEVLTHALRQTFGLDAFRPAQREVIEDALAGRDVLCVMPTGAGKSLCYQLPATLRDGLTLVVSPLISLMENQTQQLRDEGIACAMLSSGQPADENQRVLAELHSGAFKGLLYVSPERFANAAFRRLAADLRPAFLAIDEAHCISQWGHDFRPEYQQLGGVRDLLGRPTTIALTATATAEVRDDIVRTLNLDDPSVVVTGFDRPNLRYETRRIKGKRAKLDALVDLVGGEGGGKGGGDGGAIIYCATRKAVDEVTAFLTQMLPTRPVFSYHGGMDPTARTENQQRWLGSPQGVAVATNAFGMGINKPDVRLVVHYNLPGCVEAYYQEAGRAGRDGLPARCVLLFSYEDRFTQQYFIDNIRGGDDADPELVAELKVREQDKLERMIAYAGTWRCRRQQVLDYFGDAARIDTSRCRCDVCRSGSASADDDDLPRVDADTADAVRKLLSGVARLNGRVGLGTVAEVLTGGTGDRVTSRGLDRLTTHGLLRTFTLKQVIAMLHRLVEAGLVEQEAVADNPQIKVARMTASGVRVMKGDAEPPTPLVDLLPRTTRRTPVPAGTVPLQIDAESQTLFERLREARGRLAREQGLPAYCVCTDATLRLIAVHKPADVHALAAVKGMGPRRAGTYGDALLTALACEGERHVVPVGD